jgi:hypothetical protein
MSYIVVDLEDGGVDGFYSSSDAAIAIAATRNKHGIGKRVVAAQCISSTEPMKIGQKSLMGTRRAFGLDTLGDLQPPDDYQLQQCIEKATMILRDIYDMKVKKAVLLKMVNELYESLLTAECPTACKRRNP